MPGLPWLTTCACATPSARRGSSRRPACGALASAGRAVIDGTGPATPSPGPPSNPNLRPERVKEHEFGFDATAFDGRLSLDMTRGTAADRRPDHYGHATRRASDSTGRTSGSSTGVGFGSAARCQDPGIAAADLGPGAQPRHAEQRRSRRSRRGQPDVQGNRQPGRGLPARRAVHAAAPGLRGCQRQRHHRAATRSSWATRAVYMGRGTPGTLQTLTATLGLFQQQVRVSAMSRPPVGLHAVQHDPDPYAQRGDHAGRRRPERAARGPGEGHGDVPATRRDRAAPRSPSLSPATSSGSGRSRSR